jgi:hypothetical protein
LQGNERAKINQEHKFAQAIKPANQVGVFYFPKIQPKLQSGHDFYWNPKVTFEFPFNQQHYDNRQETAFEAAVEPDSPLQIPLQTADEN